jgi:hypothetical protein
MTYLFSGINVAGTMLIDLGKISRCLRSYFNINLSMGLPLYLYFIILNKDTFILEGIPILDHRVCKGACILEGIFNYVPSYNLSPF